MRNYKMEFETGLIPLAEALAEVRNKISEDYSDENLDELAEYIGQYKTLMHRAAMRYLREHGYVKVTATDGKKKWVKKEHNDSSKYESEDKQ